MSEVFISYVHEDKKIVGYLVEVLKENNISVWLDTDQLYGGLRWKDAIKKAISRGSYFVSIHSRSRQNKLRSHANEELVVAIEEIRARPSNKPYLIPVKIDECEIEDRNIGGGETLLDLNYCDLTNWTSGLRNLLTALGVKSPVLKTDLNYVGAIADYLEFDSGCIKYRQIESAHPFFQNVEHRIVSGWWQSGGSGSALYVETCAPLKPIQDFNLAINYTSFHAFSKDKRLSSDHTLPSVFEFERELIIPEGLPVPNFFSGENHFAPEALRLKTSFEARGFLRKNIFAGEFVGNLSVISNPEISQVSKGDFEIKVLSAQ